MAPITTSGKYVTANTNFDRFGLISENENASFDFMFQTLGRYNAFQNKPQKINCYNRETIKQSQINQ